MFSRCRFVIIAMLGVLCLSASALSDDAAQNKADDKQVAESKATHQTAAKSVNFRKELTLPFRSLGTLGTRVDAARRASDPVALAHAANELAVAENVSGKKASISSAALLKESAELAKLRKQAAELRAVAKVADQVSGEEQLVADLKKQIGDAEAITKIDTEASNKNAEPTWTPRKITINNYTSQFLTVFVNGWYRTEISPGLTQTLVIEHRSNPTVVTCRGDDDTDTWGPRYIWGSFQTYTWNIN
jgi:hypothetical protein